VTAEPADPTGPPVPAAAQAVGAYTARHLSVLEGLEAVRKRPGMYIGSTDSRGLMHCLWEIFDNAVDEALAGHCTAIEVVLHPDGSAEVRDNGRGIPVDVEPKTGLTGVELVMTRLHAGGKFGGGSYTASGGLHGVGASVVNALAVRMDVSVDREGHEWAASFRRGVPGEFAGDGPKASFTARRGLRKLRRVAKKVTGTRIRFWPDPQVFVRDSRWSFDALRQRARQTAYLVPGLAIRVRDERPPGDDIPAALAGAGLTLTEVAAAEGLAAVPDTPDRPDPQREEAFRFDGGISEFCAHLSPSEPVTDVVRLAGSGRFTETVPVLDGQGHMTPSDVERELAVDVALRWGNGYDTVTRSFVNVIATPKGGTHVTGFDRALVRTLNEQLRSARLLKNGDEPATKDDVAEGLTAVIAVRVPEPQFEGQTKEVLGTPAASRIVAQVVAAELRGFFESRSRASKQQARAVLEKVANAARARIAAREHRDNQRRKSALAASALPAKLVDCRSADDRSELFIVEGDSALGTAKLARDSEFQALLPIRGKILNVQKASLADMLKNAECAAIIQVIGADAGRGPGVRRGPAAAPDRAGQPPQGPAEVHLHLLRRRAAPHAAGARAQGPALEGARPALQGPGGDGRGPARGDHHGPAAPDPAPDQDRGHRGRQRHLRTAHGQRGRAPPRLHRRRRGRARPVPHRHLTGPAGPPGPGQGASPPRAVSGWRTRVPEPSRRGSAEGSSTGTPASVAPRAGDGPAQASTRASSPLRNR
jgi:DNA gyrase subunit B